MQFPAAGLRIALASLALGWGCIACSHRSTSPSANSHVRAAPLAVATGDYPAYGHAADYSWIAGSLSRSLKGGGCTYILFSPRPGAPWGGRLAVVAPDGQLRAYGNGDMVVASGDLDRTPSGCGPLAYRIKSIQEH